MRVGIMGGTLDPVHNGHIQLACAAMKPLSLDRVMLLPAGDPPHKRHSTLKIDRLKMAKLAAMQCPGLFACSVEIFRKGITYTVDTLRQLRQDNPHVEWFYLLGADTLEVLESWHRFEEVAGLCTFAVTSRADQMVNTKHMQDLERRFGARFVLLPFDGPEISSTQIRRLVAEGKDISHLVPVAVADFIREHGLYLCEKSKSEIMDILSKTLKPERYLHTLGVAETAHRLAERFGVDPMRAELAGLLHDCAKYLPVDQMRQMILRCVPDVDEAELVEERVLHAPAGAVMAREVFGVRDDEILSAIRKHTLGGPGMTAMEALIYTADFIEPHRKEFPGLIQARKLAEEDIFQAARYCAKLTNDHLVTQGKRPHARSLAMAEGR